MRPVTPTRAAAAALAMAALLALPVLSACGGGGGGDEAPVVLAIDGAPRVAASTPYAFLTGTSFVPPGSTCPPSAEYIRIGSLGEHEITALNTTTGRSYPVFDQLWVCNSEDGRVMSWQSNPIDLVAGDNLITVTMTAGARSSSAQVTVTRTGT